MNEDVNKTGIHGITPSPRINDVHVETRNGGSTECEMGSML
jgi:hypothetical protein